MGERTGYQHGVPNWVDLATSDVEGAKDFYTKLFGWTYDDVPMEAGVYSMVSKDGKLVAGLSNLPPGMEQTVWSTYLAVDDCDEATKKATEAGASVVMGPMDVFDSGRMSFITDPTGAAVGLWQAKQHFGAEFVNDAGTFVWNELLTDDTAAAEAFYTSVFGMTAETAETPTGPYTVLKVGDHQAAGMMAKNENMGPIPNAWSIYFGVDDVDAALEVVTAAGGQVLMQPFDIPEVGRMAVVQDPQGGVFNIMAGERYDP